MKLTVVLCSLLVLLVVPSVADTINITDFSSKVGVRLAGAGKTINVEKGQTIAATVSNPAILATHGLKGAKIGDGTEVTAGEKFVEEFKFNIKHVVSGREVQITYRPK